MLYTHTISSGFRVTVRCTDDVKLMVRLRARFTHCFLALRAPVHCDSIAAVTTRRCECRHQVDDEVIILQRCDALFRQNRLLTTQRTADGKTVRGDVVKQARLAERVQTRQDLQQ